MHLHTSFLLGAALFLTCGPSLRRGALAITLDVNDEQSIKDAAKQAAFGAMSYYHGNESGQIPGAFPEKWWEGGVLFQTMLDYWHWTGDDTFNDVVSQGLQWQGGENGDYLPSNYSHWLGYDDQVFWGLAAMSAAELKFPDRPTGYSWLSLAQGVFNTQTPKWDTSSCGGGLRWQMNLWQNGYGMKNSVSNAGLFQLSARLAVYTSNATYASWAEKVWDWSCSSPLLNNQTWNVGDSTDVDKDCKNLGNAQWSYNYASYLMGAVYMYTFTDGKSEKWNAAVNGLLQQILTKFFPAKYGGNIMSEICEPTEQCNLNEILFKGITSGWLAFTAVMIPSLSDQILPKLQGSAAAAAQTCTGNNNGSCGVRWYGGEWDQWSGMEEEISGASIFSAIMYPFVKDGAPVTAKTGGNSTSDPTAGMDDPHNAPQLGPITTGDRAGAGILTVLLIGGWVSTMAWMLLDGK